jgi:tetratricopeptide (TPR) repeat protein
MKLFGKFFIVLSLMLFAFNTQAKSLKEYIDEAKANQNSGKIAEAVKIMEKAVEEYPDNSSAYAYLGLYTGMQAGKTKDMTQAGQLAFKSFAQLDKAVSLDSLNPIARLNRGIMGVSVPEFLGKLDNAVKDLEFIIKIHKKAPEKVSKEILVQAYNFLAEGYEKKDKIDKANLAWKKVIEIDPKSDLAEKAKRHLTDNLKTPTKAPEVKSTEPIKYINPEELMKSGKSHLEKGECEKAVEVFKKLVEIEPKKVENYTYFAKALGCLAEKGYDENIYENTDYMSEIAFGVMNTLDKAIDLAPENPELRLLRGSIGVHMPFFLGKLEQSMKDLNMVLESKADKSKKAEALYYLGVAHQNKTTEYWDKVVLDYPSTEASRMALEGMRPGVKRIDPSKFKSAVVSVDFVLGFKDGLAPQTAVWVEDKNGKFIKTLYVSGFSGHVKEKQLWLKEWAGSSKYTDADAITAASINVGHHIYLWELKDHTGKKVKSGEYIIKVEVFSWPSMKYQLASTTIEIGGKEKRSTTEEGNVIPSLVVTYYPKK